MSHDFTFAKYRELCGCLLEAGYRTMSVRDYLRSQPGTDEQPLVVVLRHDVDRKPANSLKMAHLERELGIVATYYFRSVPGVFVPALIREAASLGHEVGYHYETLAQARGDRARAAALFERDLARFRAITSIDTVCMHGSPLSRWNNLDFWRDHDVRDYQLLGSAYLSIDYSQFVYFTDTGRTWNSAKYNLRDRVMGQQPEGINSTDELMCLLRRRPPARICIQTHPNRWADSSMELLQEATTDFAINQVKRLLGVLRRHSRPLRVP